MRRLRRLVSAVCSSAETGSTVSTVRPSSKRLGLSKQSRKMLAPSAYPLSLFGKLILVQGSHHRVRHLFPICQKNSSGTRGLSQRWFLRLAAPRGRFLCRRNAIVASQGQVLPASSAIAETHPAT